MIPKILNPLTQIGASLATIAVLTVAPSVQAATLFYDMVFYDYNNQQVGSGSFSYDNTAAFEGIFEHPFDPESSVTISASEGWYKLVSFDAQISGLNWHITNNIGITGEDSFFWQPFNGEKPASVIRDESNIPGKFSSTWLFDKDRFPILLIDNDQWLQSGSSSETSYGTWQFTQRQTPTPVPEPASILSLMIFGTGSLIMVSKTCKN